MSTYLQDERAIFNGALRITSDSYRRLIHVYRSSLQAVKSRIDSYVLDESLSRGELRRLNTLYREIDTELDTLIANRAEIIQRGFVSTYEQSFYRTGFAYEQWVNATGGAPPGAHFELGYGMLDRNAVLAAFNEEIAGKTFRDRGRFEQARLRAEVRAAIGEAVAQGETVSDLTARLRAVDEVYNHSATRALATARTELLRAHSYAQEHADAVAEAAGVENRYAWSATLAGNTRDTHAEADNQKAEVRDDGTVTFVVGGVLFSSPRVPLEGQADTAREVVNCRCRRRSEPFGFEPVNRRAALAGGEWADVRGDMTWEQWAQTAEGQAQIAETREARLEAARRARAERRNNAA